MENEEVFRRQYVAHYMSYKAAVLQKDGFMINLYYGFMNNMKHVLKERFGRSEEELNSMISAAETSIKNGQL